MSSLAPSRLLRPGNKSFLGSFCLGIQLLTLYAANIYAAAPALDNWYVSNGEVTSPCPTGAVSCKYTTADNGFLMRKVVMSASNNYWQYIMTDPNATGTPVNDAFSPTGLNFSNESIIRADNAGIGTTVTSEQYQKTLVAESKMNAANIEDRWSQVAYISTGLGWGISFEENLTQIDWTAGPNNPEVLFDSMHKAKGNLGSFGGVKDFNQILTQDIWQGTDMTQKFQYQVDALPRAHALGTAFPLLPGGSNGGDLQTGSVRGARNRPLRATYVGQRVASNTATPSLFSYTSFRDRLSYQTYTAANITELSSLKTANPLASNFNRYFTFDGAFTYGPDPLFPANVFSINPNIDTPAPTVIPTVWASGPAVDVAVTAMNNNVASPLSGGTGTEGPPIAMGGWTVKNGVIKMDPCPGTVICGPVTVGAGFIQREILVIADGSIYYQNIITDSGATGDTATAPMLSADALNGEQLSFSPAIPDTYVSSFVPPPPSNPFVPGVLTFANETFVKRGGNGISNSTQIAGITRKRGSRALRTGNQFNGIYVTSYNYTPVEAMAQRTKLNTGWAQGSGAAPVVEIKQILGIDDSSMANNVNNGLATNMFLGWRAGGQFDFTKAANGATDYTVVSVPSQNKASGLYMRKIDGGVQTTSHALADPLLIPGGTNGGNIAWNSGDTIQALWWGDSYNFYSGVTWNGFAAYTNLTTGDRTSREQSLSGPRGAAVSTNQSGGGVSPNNPASWVAPFDTPAPPSIASNTVYWPGQPLW